jgi:ADP-heptose:LPS heptosyltransferase/predicted SAM-dependent methyltransferase
MWRADDAQGNEAAKVRWEIVPYTRGQGLDLGCGAYKAFAHFVGVDNGKDQQLFGIKMAPDVVVDSCERLDCFADASQDFVFSSHLLEHLDDYAGALKEWWRVIRPGGHLLLYLPHRDLYPRIGQPGANPDHRHDFAPVDIKNAMRALGGWTLLVNQTRNAGNEYSFLQVWKKRADLLQCDATLLPRSSRRKACVVRYGGFGDMLQAAAIFPELKRQGYHLTVMTTPRGQSMLANDPHVDAFFIQDEDQVPNPQLMDFWDYQSRQFERWINLSESIEGNLLTIPGRANHLWPHVMRHKYLNHNYHEFTAEIAGLPFKPEGRFYPSEAETAEVSALVDKSRFNIVYALSGSSQHKFYAGMDQVIACLLSGLPEVHLFLAGDEACRLLEQGWENEPRVSLLCGKQSIRQTLTLAQLADCVVGPETGVLNAVGFDPRVAKVCLLSHSSVENLTKHWRNAFPIEPVDTDCYPCHRLHYGMKFCREHLATGAAMCQMSIDPQTIVAAITAVYQSWGRACREGA